MKTILDLRPFLVILLASALCACQDGPEPSRAQTGTPSQDVSEARDDNRIAARLANSVITYADVRYEAVQQGVATPEAPVQPGDGVFEGVLEQLIEQRLLALEARRQGLDRQPEARRRLTLAEERILGNYLMETLIEEAVTDEAIEAVYAQQSRMAPRRTEIRARHILLSSREEIEEAIRLIDAGQDFSALARQVSEDPATRFNGGDLGFFTRSGILPAFGEAAFSTEVGEISAPFQSEFGWHVLKVEARRQQPRPSLDEMRGSIVRFLTFDQIELLLRQLRERYSVEMTYENAPTDERETDGDAEGPDLTSETVETEEEAGGDTP